VSDMKKICFAFLCLMVVLLATREANSSCWGFCFRYIGGCRTQLDCDEFDGKYIVQTTQYPIKVCVLSTYPADYGKSCLDSVPTTVCADVDVHSASPCTPENKTGSGTMGEPTAITQVSDACGWPV